MTAPSREDLDRAIDEAAETIVALMSGNVPDHNVTEAADLCAKLSTVGSFLLAYRAARTITEVRIDDVRVTRDAGSIAGTTGGGK